MAQIQEASVERLRFEYEARQRTLLILEMKISNLTHKLEEVTRERDEHNASDSATSESIDQWTGFMLFWDGQTEAAKDARLNAEEEIAEIYRVLSGKWR